MPFKTQRTEKKRSYKNETTSQCLNHIKEESLFKGIESMGKATITENNGVVILAREEFDFNTIKDPK